MVELGALALIAASVALGLASRNTGRGESPGRRRTALRIVGALGMLVAWDLLTRANGPLGAIAYLLTAATTTASAHFLVAPFVAAFIEARRTAIAAQEIGR